MDSTIPQTVTLLAVLVAVIGAIYALRRQENTFAVLDDADKGKRILQLEQANQYLLTEIDALRAENKFLKGLMDDLQVEMRGAKKENAERFEEISALRKVLEKGQ